MECVRSVVMVVFDRTPPIAKLTIGVPHAVNTEAEVSISRMQDTTIAINADEGGGGERASSDEGLGPTSGEGMDGGGGARSWGTRS